MTDNDKSSASIQGPVVQFKCQNPQCAKPVQLDLLDTTEDNQIILCPACHESYQFDRKFIEKLSKLKKLIAAIQDAEDILDDAIVSVTTRSDEVKLPYRLLLTRLNTQINIGGIDFTFRLEPLEKNSTFR